MTKIYLLYWVIIFESLVEYNNIERSDIQWQEREVKEIKEIKEILKEVINTP